MLVQSRDDDCRTAEDVRTHAQKTREWRKRMMPRPETPAKPTEPVAELVREPSVVRLVPPVETMTPELLDFVIAAVGNTAEIQPTDILAGIPHPEVISARTLAMALAVRRCKLTPDTVAEYFEVDKRCVIDGLACLDPIMVRYAISHRTPLELTLPLIWDNWIGAVTKRSVPISEIQTAVSLVWGVTRKDLCSSRKTEGLVVPRHAAYALCKKLTLKSLPEIGCRFGGRDHTTILYGIRKFAPVISALELKIPASAKPVEWARAVQEEMAITPLADVRRRK